MHQVVHFYLQEGSHGRKKELDLHPKHIKLISQEEYYEKKTKASKMKEKWQAIQKK